MPRLIGRVTDGANLLSSAEETAVSEIAAQLERRTTDQLVLVTVPDLRGYSIEAFARALGNHHGIGRNYADNGVLLLVAPAERKVRIEVGYGLEPILTDRDAAAIIERDLLPAFRAGDMPGGVRRGTDAIVALLLARAEMPRIGACT